MGNLRYNETEKKPNTAGTYKETNCVKKTLKIVCLELNQYLEGKMLLSVSTSGISAGSFSKKGFKR